MSEAKAPLAALTMVHEEDFFLERWLAHWRKYLPDENIYVVNHGGNSDVARIAHGCNLISLPYDVTKFAVNQRRWQLLALHASALTHFYEWVAVNDVDELIALDPSVSDDLVGYLAKISAQENPPPAIIPFAIEMVHVPEIEREPLVNGEPLIGKRRCYRLNSNYAKPCLIRQPISFIAGGHGGNQRSLYVDPHLYNFHLRFIDYDLCMVRLKKSLKRRLEGKTKEEQAEMKKGQWAWVSVEGTFKALSQRLPSEETIDHPDFRRQMLDSKILRPPYTLMGGGRPKVNYRLPERFNGVL